MEQDAARSHPSGECQSGPIEGYRQMALDREQQAEAEEWTEGLIGDAVEADESAAY